MIAWVRNWWWAQQRSVDLRILWPQCKRLSPSLDHAKAVFMLHAINCPAWVRFYGERLVCVIDELS